MPHLGVSTEEAKNEAAAHGTEYDLKDCLEDGTICNSVNYSATSLPDCPSGSIHLTVVNRNVPGILAKIRDTVTKSTLDIVQQVNHSRGEIAYNVMDIDTSGHGGDDISFKKMQGSVPSEFDMVHQDQDMHRTSMEITYFDMALTCSTCTSTGRK